jgi:hypothetical protein
MEISVALSDKMSAYLRLERLMIDLDDHEDPFAERVRDSMDPLWFSMTDEEHEFLDSRGQVDLRVLYPVTLSIDDLFKDLPEVCVSPVIVAQPKNGIGKIFPIEDVIPCAA